MIRLKAKNRIKLLGAVILYFVVIALALSLIFSPTNLSDPGVAISIILTCTLGLAFALIRKPLLSSILFLVGFILVLLLIA